MIFAYIDMITLLFFQQTLQFIYNGFRIGVHGWHVVRQVYPLK